MRCRICNFCDTTNNIPTDNRVILTNGDFEICLICHDESMDALLELELDDDAEQIPCSRTEFTMPKLPIE